MSSNNQANQKNYRIFGAEMSPYSVKVRSYFRYKQIPHQWIHRGPATQEEYSKYARIPIVPAVATPEDEGLQDSTPILEYLDKRHPEPSTHPEDPVLAFLSLLLEEFGDEWGNKLMFHYRWWAEADQIACSHVLAQSMVSPDGDARTLAAIAAQIRERMTSRGNFVGSNAETAPLIEQYLITLVALLESHLAQHRFLFGDRPSFGDFGISHQIYECVLDPTAGAIIRTYYPETLSWSLRMLDPCVEGDWADQDSLMPTLTPLLEHVGSHFLPWSQANAKALMAGDEEFSVDLAGQAYKQQPQKYHAKSLKAIREKYALVVDNKDLAAVLSKTDCLRYLA